MVDPNETAISAHIWATRYRAPGEAGIGDTWRRVARAVAAAEDDPAAWAKRFERAMTDFRFVPGGRILAGAGSGRDVTLLNCFVMGVLPDDLEGALEGLKEGVRTMQRGGGVGYDFSTLSPFGSPSADALGPAPGPVAAMRVWDATCAMVAAAGARRGAMMATLRCDHPDIERFVDAKADPGELRRFNVSVQVTDALIEAVRADTSWPLVFPDPAGTVSRVWTGTEGLVPCRVERVVRARDLWERILRATYRTAEPGVLFVDRVQAWDNLGWRQRVTAANPCGEVPLQPYGACDLGAIDLVAYVRSPFTPSARLDLAAIARAVPVAVRFLDDVLDVTRYPLEAQRVEAHATRRLGLGMTGLGDALIALGVRYDSPAAVRLVERVTRTIALAAYRASVALAREKGAFPALDVDRFLACPFPRQLPASLRAGIARYGIRNSHLLAVAPAGTISLLAGNVSSGIEPVFGWRYGRDVMDADGSMRRFELSAWSWRHWQARGGGALPTCFLRAEEIAPVAQLQVQAAVQRWVDNAVSKTILVPQAMSFAAFRDVYDRAWALGLKGCTTWRPNPVTGTVLSPVDDCGATCAPREA